MLSRSTGRWLALPLRDRASSAPMRVARSSEFSWNLTRAEEISAWMPEFGLIWSKSAEGASPTGSPVAKSEIVRLPDPALVA